MKTNHYLFTILALVSFSFTACTPDEEDNCENFEWSYEGESGPDFWADCETGCGGDMQSPINLTGASIDTALPQPDAVFASSDIDLINNGHSIQLNYDAGSSFTLEGVQYDLKQVHFHTGSEHLQDGIQHEMEVHLVHANAAGTHNVVIGIFIELGAENPFLAALVNNLPATVGATFTAADTVNILDVFPELGSYYTYEGSLTTPPCSQTVTWFILDTPAEATAAQVEAFHSLLHYNYRPTQPLNGRVIKRTV